jgi:ferredoxin
MCYTFEIMSRVATFFIQKHGQKDDVINIFNMSSEGMHDMYKVVYQPHDISSKYTCYYTRIRVLNYVYNLLQTLSSDVEPFDYFQLSTMTAPSVMYNVGDISDTEIRNEIMEAVCLAVESCPVKNES